MLQPLQQQGCHQLVLGVTLASGGAWALNLAAAGAAWALHLAAEQKQLQAARQHVCSGVMYPCAAVTAEHTAGAHAVLR